MGKDIFVWVLNVNLPGNNPLKQTRHPYTPDNQNQVNRKRDNKIRDNVTPATNTLPANTSLDQNRHSNSRNNQNSLNAKTANRVPDSRNTVNRNNLTVNHNNTVIKNRQVTVNKYYAGNNYYRGHYWNSRPNVIYNSYNPSWRYNYYPRYNTIVNSFPFAYSTIPFGSYRYRYYDGIFYRPFNTGFIVSEPPFGIFINTLPFGYRRIYVGQDPYYYYNGTYYADSDKQFKVVSPPVGAVVESLPSGYETVTVDGETYYKVGSAEYKPAVQDNGEIWYEVIKAGTESGN